MKHIAYTAHLQMRLELRDIPQEYPQVIVSDPDARYWDVAERRHIAVKRLPYLGSSRPLMVAYDETELSICIVTIHPIAEKQLANRVARGRWRKDD